MQTKTTTLKIRYSQIIEIDGAPTWVYEQEGASPQEGDSLYVIRIDNLTGRGDAASYRLNTTPMVTNSSHEPRVTGWLGATNDRSLYALGRYQVVGGSSTHMHLRQLPAEPEA